MHPYTIHLCDTMAHNCKSLFFIKSSYKVIHTLNVSETKMSTIKTIYFALIVTWRLKAFLVPKPSGIRVKVLLKSLIDYRLNSALLKQKLGIELCKPSVAIKLGENCFSCKFYNLRKTTNLSLLLH